METAENIQPQDQIIIRKCRCDSVWCPQCFKLRKVPKLYSRINDRLDWRSTRQIVLTIDRAMFDDGEKAYLYIQAKKAIPQLIHNLKRTHGIEIRDYVWVLEWHRDGFPHWHVFVDVTQKGVQGQINFKRIQKYWRYGNVEESYFKNELHWKRLVGYFGKHGYFEKKKAHQSKLPLWALNYKRTIKRTGSAALQCHLPDPKKIEEKKEREKMRNEFKKETKQANEQFYATQGHYHQDHDHEETQIEKKTYGVLLEKCGSTCLATFMKNGLPYIGFNIPIPYWEMRKRYDQGEMVDGIGYVLTLNIVEFHQFTQMYLPKFIK